MKRHWLAWMVLISSLLVCLAWKLRLRINATSSMPHGVYQIIEAPLERGGLISFCLPTGRTPWEGRGYTGTGDCPDGSRPLLKILAGLPGDVVDISNDGIRINTRLQPQSAARTQDRHGRAMQSILHTGSIPDGYGLALSPVATSFDSRYFGLVPISDMHAVRAVFTLQP